MKVVLQIVRSQKDPESGLPIQNLKWNREFLDLPKINRDEQNVPAFDAEQINKLVADSEGDERMLYILLAATGLRIGEGLGWFGSPSRFEWWAHIANRTGGQPFR